MEASRRRSRVLCPVQREVCSKRETRLESCKITLRTASVHVFQKGPRRKITDLIPPYRNLHSFTHNFALAIRLFFHSSKITSFSLPSSAFKMSSYTLSCSMNPSFGLTISLPSLTHFNATSLPTSNFHIKYAQTTVAERLIPIAQCTKTPPPP